ncbi:MAG: hypothetical protein HYR84_16555 [Planctomycetes bacterium]|nr:hypothetical protein [Planctomycetota bacterium]
MLSEQEVKQALHANRVIPIDVPNPHGPLGWQHLGHTLARFLTPNDSGTKVVKSLEIPAETWNKLEQLAAEAARSEARPVSASDLAAAILQHYVGREE